MKFIYPAVFRPTEDKKYNAFFPDLACCEANGDTLDDAIENANAAGSTQSLWNLRESFLRFPMRAIWSFRRETLSAISL